MSSEPSELEEGRFEQSPSELEVFFDRIARRIAKVRRTLRIVQSNNLAKIGTAGLLIFLLMAVFAPQIAPHDPHERIVTEDGEWVKGHPPSVEYPLGTTSSAFPIFSRLVFATRVAWIAGLLTAFMVGGIGTLAGMTAGYYGGHVENAIMRLVDIAYGVPFLPMAIVLIMLFEGTSIWAIIIVISIILWRNTARVIRSEVISIKEQPMIDAAKASGASDFRIIAYHILPKVLPTTVLYSVFAIGWAIISEAGLSFIGFGDPELISWGKMLNSAYARNALQADLWLWIFPPGICIVLFVLFAYFVAQGIEEVVNPQLRSIE